MTSDSYINKWQPQIKVLSAICLFGIFIPNELELVGMSSFQNIFDIISFVSAVCLLIIGRSKIKFDLVFLLSFLFCLTCLLYTVCFGQLTLYFFKNIIMFMVVWVLVIVNISVNPLRFFDQSRLIIGLILLLNLTFMVLVYQTNPYGFTSGDSDAIWLLGNKNQLRNWIFPLLVACFIYDYISDRKLSKYTIFFCIVSIVTVIMAQSATSTVLIIAFVSILVLLWMKLLPKRLFSPAKVFVVYVAGFVSCVFLRKVPFLSDFITGVLNRNLEFTGRTLLWDTALNKIADNPFLGTGLRPSGSMGLMISNGRFVGHAHDALLDTWLKFGLLGVLFAAALLALAIKNLSKCIDWYPAVVCSLALGCFLIAGIFGELFNLGFFLVLLICCYFPKIYERFNQ